MANDRAAPRYRVEEPAWIEYGGDKTPCIVRDLSASGALIEVSFPKNVPEQFTLVIPGHQLRLSSQVVRRSDFRIGIKFD